MMCFYYVFNYKTWMETALEVYEPQVGKQRDDVERDWDSTTFPLSRKGLWLKFLPEVLRR